MDARYLRAQAQRCRDLLRVAIREEVRVQLRQWADAFDEEAARLENAPASDQGPAQED